MRARRHRHQVRAHNAQFGPLVVLATEDRVLERSLCDLLAAQGYRGVVCEPSTAGDVIERVQPTLVLLDLDRTDGDGAAALIRIHDRSPTTPIIAMSVRGTEADKVSALDVGAEDYVTKPVGTSELLARVRVVLRRAGTARDPELFEVGPIRVDHARYLVTVEGRPVHLTPIEFRLLAILAQYAGRVVTRDQLLREVWGTNGDHAHYLRVYVASLRRKLEKTPGSPRWLVTVKGVGYRLRDSARDRR